MREEGSGAVEATRGSGGAGLSLSMWCVAAGRNREGERWIEGIGLLAARVRGVGLALGRSYRRPKWSAGLGWNLSLPHTHDRREKKNKERKGKKEKG